jgi:hypothetical protein
MDIKLAEYLSARERGSNCRLYHTSVLSAYSKWRKSVSNTKDSYTKSL